MLKIDKIAVFFKLTIFLFLLTNVIVKSDEFESEEEEEKSVANANVVVLNELTIESNRTILKCSKQKSKQCSLAPIECMQCSIDSNPKSADCVYGETIKTNCTVKKFTQCQGERSFELEGVCRFCYQTPEWMQICAPVLTCRRENWIRLFKTNCTVDENIVCLGARGFYKKIECNWTSGYKWNVAMVLSVFFGGFGVDRFYLGLYKEGLGKLFSFGGLGVWTLVDMVLIYVGYIGPADGSIYI